MKTETQNFFSLASAAAVVVLAFALPRAEASDSGPGNPSTNLDADDQRMPPDDTASGTDEGVGTLPVLADPDLNSNSPLADMLPDNVLSDLGLPLPYLGFDATWEDVKAIILDATGAGVVSVLPDKDPLSRTLKFGFHGDIDLAFDIAELRARDIEPTIKTGIEFEGAQASVCWDGTCTSPSSLIPTNGFLSFGSLIDSGVLATSSIQFVAVSASESSIFIDVSKLGEIALGIVQRVNP